MRVLQDRISGAHTMAQTHKLMLPGEAFAGPLFFVGLILIFLWFLLTVSKSAKATKTQNVSGSYHFKTSPVLIPLISLGTFVFFFGIYFILLLQNFSPNGNVATYHGQLIVITFLKVMMAFAIIAVAYFFIWRLLMWRMQSIDINNDALILNKGTEKFCWNWNNITGFKADTTWGTIAMSTDAGSIQLPSMENFSAFAELVLAHLPSIKTDEMVDKNFGLKHQRMMLNIPFFAIIAGIIILGHANKASLWAAGIIFLLLSILVRIIGTNIIWLRLTKENLLLRSFRTDLIVKWNEVSKIFIQSEGLGVDTIIMFQNGKKYRVTSVVAEPFLLTRELKARINE